jgi:hypothetical protein
MSSLTKAHQSLCILLVLSLFFMGCSSVNSRSKALSMQSQGLAIQADADFSDSTAKTSSAGEAFIKILLIISLVGLIVILVGSDRKGSRRTRSYSSRSHSGHYHHDHCDCR